MRIVITTDKLSRGGKEKQLMILARGLLLRDHDVHIISKHNVDPLNFYDEIPFPENRIHALGSQQWRIAKRRFQKVIREIEPTVLLNFDIQSSLWSIQLKRSINNLNLINCTIRRGIPGRSLISEILSKRSLRKSKHIVANSKAGLELYNINEDENHRVIYNAIYKDEDHSVTIDLNDVFGIPLHQDSVVIANVASLYKHKGQITLLKAIKKINDKRYHVMLIGEGPEREKLKSFIEKNNLANQVVLLGLKNDVLPYLQAADLYVHTSTGEGCSNAILEAMAADLPLITAPDGGTKEIVYTETSAFFRVGDHVQLTQSIKESHLAQDLDKEGLQNWMTKFELDQYIDNYEDFINHVNAE